MKRLFSILLILVLAFSLFGYRMVIDCLQKDADNHITKVINESGYHDSELVSLKVPVTLPYYANSAEYHFAEGTVNLDGTLYRYVKRRIFNDSIEYLCLKDARNTKLHSARDQFFQLAFELQKEKPGSNSSPVKLLLLEYCAFAQEYTAPNFDGWIKKSGVPYKPALPAAKKDLPLKPPEAIQLPLPC